MTSILGLKAPEACAWVVAWVGVTLSYALPARAAGLHDGQATEIALPSPEVLREGGALPAPAVAAAGIRIERVPEGGVQPQAAVDGQGIAHVIYLKGDPARCDVFYVRSGDGGITWSAPVRVNSQPGSAIALGTVRGAQIAIGRAGRVHVAWMGSNDAEPKAPGKATPMLYARLSDDGRSFGPQRNVIRSHVGLDGGGSIAADDIGNVYVAWHAPDIGGRDEQARRVWVARSKDDGQSFEAEKPISDDRAGACGCCGMRIVASGGQVLALYRGAAQQVNRGMHLAESGATLSGTSDRELAAMKAGMCIMSTSAFWPERSGVLAAWEDMDQIEWANLDHPSKLDRLTPHAIRGGKHPALASDELGHVLVAWTEGTGWAKGGSVAWRLFDAEGRAFEGSAQRRPDLPVWDSPAVFCTPKAGFVVMY